MSARIKGVVLLLTAGFLTGQTWADGKFFVLRVEKVPANVPYQRAFLIFDEGTETLIVQSKYELPESGATDALAWVVPAPSVPELASMDAEAARQFFLAASLSTQPRVRHYSRYLYLALFALFLVCAAATILHAIRCYTAKEPVALNRHRRALGKAALLTFLLFLVLSVSMGTLSATRGGLEVIKSEQVGIYDVTVVRGNSPEAIQEWLRENSFAFDDRDKAAFADYVARGWCFVTARVSPDAEVQEGQIAAEGMAAPLVLTFATEKPVYPLALTATAGPETEILIYTLTANKLTCGDRLTLHCARKQHPRSVVDRVYFGTDSGTFTPIEGLPDRPMMLGKFKGTITAAQMAEDLVFEPAPDNATYQETIWTW
jgi:hypothetical protein